MCDVNSSDVFQCQARCSLYCGRPNRSRVFGVRRFCETFGLGLPSRIGRLFHVAAVMVWDNGCNWLFTLQWARTVCVLFVLYINRSRSLWVWD